VTRAPGVCLLKDLASHSRSCGKEVRAWFLVHDFSCVMLFIDVAADDACSTRMCAGLHRVLMWRMLAGFWCRRSALCCFTGGPGQC